MVARLNLMNQVSTQSAEGTQKKNNDYSYVRHLYLEEKKGSTHFLLKKIQGETTYR
jgi:hypothetical protein